eukprot:7340629-Prymnesium_polylepis.1
MRTLSQRGGYLPPTGIRPPPTAPNGQQSSAADTGEHYTEPLTVDLQSGESVTFESGRSIVGFDSADALKAWLALHPGRCGVAVVFGDTRVVTHPDGSSGPAQAVTTELPAAVNYEI